MQRDELTQPERRTLQREYHKGTDAQRRVMRELFGQGLTYSSGMAHSNTSVERKKMHAFAGRVSGANPNLTIGPYSDMTEPEFWEWVCRAAWHGVIWKHRQINGIQFWVELHRMYAGYGFRIEGNVSREDIGPWILSPMRDIDAEETYRLLVPDDIAHTWQTRAWQVGHFLLANAVRVGSAVIIASLGAVAALILERALAG